MKDGVIRPDHVVGHPFGHPETEAHQQQTADSIYAYFDAVIDERAGGRRDDLLSHFMYAEVDGERLTRDEILDICFLFLIAGLDTVTASLDCYLRRISPSTPRRDRRSSRSPTPSRRSSRSCCVGRRPSWASPGSRPATRRSGASPSARASRSWVSSERPTSTERSSQNAGALDWERAVNPHLAFGGGIHRCLGSHLARLELAVVLREWHRRIPDYSIKPGAELEFTAGIRTLKSFPMLLLERR